MLHLAKSFPTVHVPGQPCVVEQLAPGMVGIGVGGLFALQHTPVAPWESVQDDPTFVSPDKQPPNRHVCPEVQAPGGGLQQTPVAPWESLHDVPAFVSPVRHPPNRHVWAELQDVVGVVVVGGGVVVPVDQEQPHAAT